MNSRAIGTFGDLEKIKRTHGALDTFVRIFKSPSAKLGGVLFAVIIILSLAAPLIAPYGPYEMDFKSIYSLPGSAHIMGTDSVGRDIFSRLLYGGKYSLCIGLVAEAISMFLGIVIGSIAGYFGKNVEMLIMRFCDMWSAIPGMLLTILLSAVLGSGFFNTVLALSLGGVPGTVRLIRSRILVEKGREYIESAEAINCSKVKIMFSHLLPNTISPVLVSSSMGIGRKITAAAGLSYLGLGILPPTPEWGAMLSDGTKVLLTFPHVVLYPGVAIGLLILCINLIGDGLRDALDPKLRY